MEEKIYGNIKTLGTEICENVRNLYINKSNYYYYYYHHHHHYIPIGILIKFCIKSIDFQEHEIPGSSENDFDFWVQIQKFRFVKGPQI